MATEERILGCALRNLACSSTHCAACGEVASDRVCSRRTAWLGLGLGLGVGLGLGLLLGCVVRVRVRVSVRVRVRVRVRVKEGRC